MAVEKKERRFTSKRKIKGGRMVFCQRSGVSSERRPIT